MSDKDATPTTPIAPESEASGEPPAAAASGQPVTRGPRTFGVGHLIAGAIGGLVSAALVVIAFAVAGIGPSAVVEVRPAGYPRVSHVERGHKADHGQRQRGDQQRRDRDQRTERRTGQQQPTPEASTTPPATEQGR